MPKHREESIAVELAKTFSADKKKLVKKSNTEDTT